MGTAATATVRYTWDDYRAWPDDRRWELIDGEAYAMSPSPGTLHQMVQMRLGSALDGALRGGTCRAIAAPMDVRLSDLDVVQPDVLVVCKPEQIRETHIEGAPALVVEILSDATELRDRGVKMRLYAAHGVPEVWLARPRPSLIEVYRLDGESYRLAATFAPPDVLRSAGFPKLKLKLDAVFDFPRGTESVPRVVREGPPARAPDAARGARNNMPARRHR
jgi:Uma2 family endonuclease